MALAKIIFWLPLGLLWASILYATDIQILVVASPERDALQRQYEDQLAANSKDIQVFKELGIIYHMQAVEGTRPHPELVNKSYNLLKRAYEQDKQDLITLSYYGSVTTMMALSTDDSMQQMRFVKSGARRMDKAIKKSQDNIILRLVRGNNSIGLPKFLQRTRYAVEDFGHVLKIAPSLPLPMKAELLFKIGEAYALMEQPSEAESHWKQAHEVAPDSTFGKMAQSRL